MNKKILVNQSLWQTRISITRDGKLENIYFEAHREQPLERVFFKGTVTSVLPGIQTAFVDIGQEKAGFLHISEIDRDLALERMQENVQLDDEERAPRPRNRERPDISKIFKEGEQILVQVSKEPLYEKGPKLTTCFTLPGRYIVLMPNIPRIGVSKKIEDRTERQRLKDIVQRALPEGMGAIIRTTSEEATEQAITKDVAFLVETWNMIQKKFASAQPGERIYEDIELTLAIIRDHLDESVEAIIVDSKESESKIYKFIKNIAPEFTYLIKFYQSEIPLFEQYDIERQIDAALERKVMLKSGGSLIIETTEAMTVVDVNTGRFTGKKNLEETIFATNMEAAQEIVRQLRLRNIGGLIVIDFIDMAMQSNRQKLFNFFEKTLREQDKFQSVVLKISEFGLVQMTRKRSGLSLMQQLLHKCEQCHGLGFVKSLQTQAYTILQNVQQELKQYKDGQVLVSVSPELFDFLTNVEYNAILALEKMLKIKIILRSVATLASDKYTLERA